MTWIVGCFWNEEETLIAMGYNLIAMASSLLAMASNLLAMASNLEAMASNLINSDHGLQPRSDGLHLVASSY